MVLNSPKYFFGVNKTRSYMIGDVPSQLLAHWQGNLFPKVFYESSPLLSISDYYCVVDVVTQCGQILFEVGFKFYLASFKNQPFHCLMCVFVPSGIFWPIPDWAWLALTWQSKLWINLSIANWVLYKRDLDGENYCFKFIVKFRKWKLYIF